MKKLTLLLTTVIPVCIHAQQKPNVIIILSDDLGYGDLGCYGATKIHTPNIDGLANDGLRFTNAHSSASTSTPSRFSLLTGQYAFRKKEAQVLPGDAPLIISTEQITLPKIFKQAGYATGIVGKWHLGLGNQTEKNWNGIISPGPNEIGFDYSFFFPATADRVPTVFIENHQVVAAEANDSIQVSYKRKIGNDPTGKENPELLKMRSSEGHAGTIVNGIARIGFMKGGYKARWVDEELSYTFLDKAKQFINQHQNAPFFLYYTPVEPHSPRMPATVFKGKSGLGYRGDAILQLDWSIGELRKELQRLGIDKNTIIIFTSDNGPVLDDGYEDGAVPQLNGHTPAGVLRGGKYSIYEAGTRMPFIVTWQKEIKSHTVSNALVSQTDFLSSFASFLKIPVSSNNKIDSKPLWNALIGKNLKGRNILVEQSSTLAIVKDGWKYIAPKKGSLTIAGVESGLMEEPQLYNLNTDIREQKNVAKQYPDKVKQLSELLEEEKTKQE